MKFLLLFTITAAGGGLGRMAGILLGAQLAPGLGIVLQLVLGVAFLVAAVYAAVRLGFVRRTRLGWTIVGGTLGVGMATLVSLSTIFSPVAPYVIPILIGIGSAFGSLIGKSAHERPDLT